MGALDLSIVIPAFDAAHCLDGMLARVRQYGDGRGIPFEIIAVDDGSTDETPSIIEANRRADPRIRGVSFSHNRGKGAAVRAGMLAARGDVRLFADADGSTDISYLEAAEEAIRSGADIAIASRSPRDAAGARQEVPQPLPRRIAGTLGNALIRAAALRGIHDTQCGFKLFRAEAAERLFALSRIDGWAFDVEVLLLARRLGFRIAIFPVRWRHDPVSAVTPASYAATLRDLLRVRWDLWRGGYRR